MLGGRETKNVKGKYLQNWKHCVEWTGLHKITTENYFNPMVTLNTLKSLICQDSQALTISSIPAFKCFLDFFPSLPVLLYSSGV